MQGVNRSLRRSSASSSYEPYHNNEQTQKAQLKRVIDFLQDQYEGLASELASKELELKVAKSRRLPTQSFQFKNQEYETKSQINQLKFKHMTELQQTIAEHQLEVDLIRTQFQQKMQRQYENYKREFNKLKNQSSNKLEEQLMEVSEKNMELNRTITQLEVRIRDADKKAARPQLQSQIKQLKKDIISKQSQISRLQRKVRDSQEYTQQLKQKLLQKNKEIDYFVAEIGRDKTLAKPGSVEKNNVLRSNNNDEIQELNDQLIFLKEENDRLRKLNEKYKGFVTEKESQLQTLQQKISALNKDIGSYCAKIQSLEQDIKQHQTGKKILENQTLRLNETVQRGIGDLYQKQSEIITLNVSIEKLKEENTVINNRILDQQSEKQRLQSIIARQNEKIGTLEDQLRGMTNKHQKKEYQIEDLNKIIQENQMQLKGLKIAFQTKNGQFETIYGENREHIVKNQKLKDDYNDSKNIQEELKRKLTKVEQDNNDLIQSLKQLKVEYQNIRIQNITLKEIQQDSDRLKNQIVQLQQQLKITKDDSRKYIQEIYKYKLDLEEALIESSDSQRRLKQFEEEKVEYAERCQLQSQVHKYTGIVQNASKLNSQLNLQIRTLKDSNHRLTQEKASLQKKLQKLQEKYLKIKNLQKQSSSIQLQSQVTRLQLLISNLQNQKTFIQTKVGDALKEKQKTINILQKQISEISLTGRDKEDQYKHQTDNLYRNISDAKQQIQQLKSDLEMTIIENTKLKNDIKNQSHSQSNEIQGLKEELKRKTYEYQNLQKRWNTLRQEQMQRITSDKQANNILESQLSASKTKLELLELSLKDKQGEIERLQNKYQRMLTEKESMEIQLDQLKIQQWKQRATIQNFENDKQSILKQQKTKQVIFQQQLNILKSENKQLSSTNEQLEDHIKQIEKQMNRVEIDNQMLSQSLVKLQKERVQAKDNLIKIDLQLASMKVENQSLKRKKPQINSPKTSFSQTTKYKEEIDKQRKLRKQFEDEADNLRRNASTVTIGKQKQNKSKDKQFYLLKTHELQMEVKRLNEQIRVNSVQFNELLKYRSDLQMKLIQTGDQLRKLRQELAHRNNHQTSYMEKKDVDVHKMTEYIKQLQMRVKLIEDINTQLRKRQFEQQQKVTRILADNKSELTHYKLQNNRIQKENTQLQIRIKQLNHAISQLQALKGPSKGKEQLMQLKEELRNVYGQVHSLNSLLIQKQNQIASLMNNQPLTIGSLKHIGSPKEKRVLRNTEQCWKDAQDRIKTGQREYNKARSP